MPVCAGAGIDARRYGEFACFPTSHLHLGLIACEAMTSRKIGLMAAAVAALGAVSAPMISTTLVGRQVDGSFLLVNHQLVKPWGTQTLFQGRPVDMAFDPSKRWLAVLSGTEVAILDGSSGSVIDRVKSKTTSYAGIAFSPDGKEIWASEATRSGPDSLLLISSGPNGTVTKTDRLNLPGHSVPADRLLGRWQDRLCGDAPGQCAGCL